MPCVVTTWFYGSISTAMEVLIQSVSELFFALWNVVYALLVLLLPWTPLAAWIVFWLFAVSWISLRKVMLSGGFIGVVLLGLVIALVWGVVAPPEGGSHFILGLTLSNFVGKIVYVTALFCIMFLCGSLQLAGCCGECCRFEDDEPVVHVPQGGAAH